MFCVKMAHTIKVTLYIYTNLTTGSSSQVLKILKILLKDYQRSNFQSKKSPVTSLTHYRITPNFRFGVDMKFHELFLRNLVFEFH